MEKQLITVFIKNRPYHLTLEIDQQKDETIYKVSQDQEADKLSEFIPRNLEFDVNGTVQLDKRIRTVEGEEIARAIWNAIHEEQRKREPGEGM